MYVKYSRSCNEVINWECFLLVLILYCSGCNYIIKFCSFLRKCNFNFDLFNKEDVEGLLVFIWFQTMKGSETLGSETRQKGKGRCLWWESIFVAFCNQKRICIISELLYVAFFFFLQTNIWCGLGNAVWVFE